MTKEWRQFVSERCLKTLTENVLFMEEEKNTVYTDINQSALRLCFIAGANDAKKIFHIKSVDLENKNVMSLCENELNTNSKYIELKQSNADNDDLQEFAETICYECGFRKTIFNE